MQYDLFMDRKAYHDVVISEDPYVKIIGDIGWSPTYNCYAAPAQFENVIAIVSLRLTQNGKPLYISAADKSVHDTAARYAEE